jgi:hypothetical protein
LQESLLYPWFACPRPRLRNTVVVTVAEQAAVASAAVAEQAVVASAAVAVFTAEALTAVATMVEDMALVAIAVAGVRRMAVAAPTVGWGAAHPRAVFEEARPPVVETRAVGPDGVPAT